MNVYSQTIIYIFQWWAILLILGIVFLPLTVFLFRRFTDKGYLFSKIIGAIAISYLSLVLGELHILPFSLFSLWVILVVFLFINLFIFKRFFSLSVKQLIKIVKIPLLEELIFLLALTFWSFIRGFQPDIHGLEKFMDFGFVNSILRSTYFPPKDMWMAPLTINYYYFGHLVTAVLTRFSMIPSFITFNLMVATIFAFTFSVGFSLGGNLWTLFRKNQNVKIKKIPFIISGFLSAFLLTFAGNLHTLYTFFTPYQNDTPVPPWQLIFSPQTFPNSYWYPNATRFIYHTIHEFPIYSFVVSDLHGHVLDIPFVLLMIATLLIVFTTPQEKFKLYRFAILLGAINAILYMTNAWDGLIYLLFSEVILIYKIEKNSIVGIIKEVLSIKALNSFLILLASFITISLPFSLFFKPFASQIGINCAPEFLLKLGNIGPIIFEQGYCQYSPWWQLLILYGFFFFWIISFLVLLWKQRKGKEHQLDNFIFLLSFLAVLLIIAPEFVYLKDIYTTYFRANTMFKLVYQAFIILSLSSAYMLLRIFTAIKRNIFALLYITISCVLLVIVGIYPYFAITSYYNNLKEFHGLDGITYLKTISVGDYEAVNWMNSHISGQPTILEAQGDSYTDYERISSNTGLPTVFGWTVHEWLWRGTYDIVPPRIADVENLYELHNLDQTKKLLKKYQVQYVYIGDMERTKYPQLDENKFKQLGKVVYQNSSVTIYKIKNL